MKKAYAALLVVGLSISAFAADRVPSDTKGGVTPPAYAGTNTCVITASTGTTALLCATGAGIILQVIGSSVATTDYLTFRDSATANVVSSTLTSVSKGDLAGIYVYPRFYNGLSVNASSAPGAVTGAWTIIYTKPAN